MQYCYVQTVDPTQTYMLMSKLRERRVSAEVCALYEISLNYAHYLHIGGRLKRPSAKVLDHSYAGKKLLIFATLR